MKSRDIYVISLSTLHIFLFFKLLSLAEQLTGVRSFANKQAFVIGFGVLIGVSIFLLLQNVSRIISVIALKEEHVPARIIPIAQISVSLLTLVLIATLLKNFILYR